MKDSEDLVASRAEVSGKGLLLPRAQRAAAAEGPQKRCPSSLLPGTLPGTRLWRRGSIVRPAPVSLSCSPQPAHPSPQYVRVRGGGVVTAAKTCNRHLFALLPSAFPHSQAAVRILSRPVGLITRLSPGPSCRVIGWVTRNHSRPRSFGPPFATGPPFTSRSLSPSKLVLRPSDQKRR